MTKKNFHKPLEFCGRHAKKILPIGVFIAFFLPETGGFFKPVAPFILALLVSVAMIRLNIAEVLKNAVQPVRLLRNTCLALVLLIIIPFCLFFTAVTANVPESIQALVTWYAVSPPIGTTIWMCVFLGFSAPIAMEIVLLTNFLAPFTGPLMGEILLGEAVPLSIMSLSFRLGAILFGGVFIAVVIKWWLGDERIIEYRERFDGIATVLLLAFLVPVFDGVSKMAFAEPLLSFGLVVLAITLNFGHQSGVVLGGRLLAALRRKPVLPAGTRSIAVVSGNRNLGLYFAALPADPLFSMFVAAYQIPIYLTPMIAGWLGDRSERKSHCDKSTGL